MTKFLQIHDENGQTIGINLDRILAAEDFEAEGALVDIMRTRIYYSSGNEIKSVVTQDQNGRS